jgi:eukaryotic-like serine/threonine-protein kinase
MAQDTELAGHVLGGKYRLVRPVSEGPRRVYEARHERLSGRFAVKVWPATTPWDAFRRGAELAITLRHPGVVQLLDFNCEPGSSPFLVLEWVDGTRLSDVIAESGIMPIERVAPLIESAAWALASAHQQGVVHQELRPDELLVVHAPGTMREWVKIAGFGVSAALARAGTAPPSRYRAPEQLVDGDDGDDPQSDQYALAAIAYEMLAGVPPFDEERSQPEPLPISDLAPGVSPAVDAAIRQALAVEPERRFAGVLEFARALRSATEGASPEAVRRSGATGRTDGRPGEPVSPFFNPLQGASEALRRVRTSTARLRTLASERLKEGPLLPTRSSARIALASGLLLLAFSGAALLLRGAPHRAPVSEAPAPPVAAPTPKITAPAAPAPPVVPALAAPAPAGPAEPPPTIVVAADDQTVKADDAPSADAPTARGKPKHPRTAAWARLTKASPKSDPTASKPVAATNKIVATTASAKPTAAPKAVTTATKPRAAPVKTAAAATGPGSGPCALTVGSRPPADVWIDEHSLGRRTPVIGYHLACGDHKLALKRADLDIYQMEIITLRAGTPFKKIYPLQ